MLFTSFMCDESGTEEMGCSRGQMQAFGSPQGGPGSPGAILSGWERKHSILNAPPRMGLTFSHHLLVFSPAHPVLPLLSLYLSPDSSHLEAPAHPHVQACSSGWELNADKNGNLCESSGEGWAKLTVASGSLEGNRVWLGYVEPFTSLELCLPPSPSSIYTPRAKADREQLQSEAPMGSQGGCVWGRRHKS